MTQPDPVESARRHNSHTHNKYPPAPGRKNPSGK